MKLYRAPAEGRQVFAGYGAGYVEINERRHERNVVVTAEGVSDWHVASFDRLSEADFESLRVLAPEIVILGTGRALRFPPPALSQPLLSARIGFEVMDTPAACRTFNILTAEGRRVAAAILVDSPVS